MLRMYKLNPSLNINQKINRATKILATTFRKFEKLNKTKPEQYMVLNNELKLCVATDRSQTVHTSDQQTTKRQQPGAPKIIPIAKTREHRPSS